MNFLQEWESQHRKNILEELKAAKIEILVENISEIIEETSFMVRSKKYPEKCPYYQQEKTCHPEIKDLSCFLCACPNYESHKLVGGCKINSRKGRFHSHQNLPDGKVWDCSYCNINHHPEEVRKYLIEHIRGFQS